MVEIPHPDLAGGRLTIDLGALVSNWKLLAKNTGDAECGAVVKANAYGCGIEPVVETLNKDGCKTFFVAVAEEGKRVKRVAPESRCFVLNGLFPEAAPHYEEAGLIPILGSLPEVEAWANYAKQKDAALPCAIHMDSGMTRLGMSKRELERLIASDHLMDHIEPQLFMTHYACADDIGHPKTETQREAFIQASYLLPGAARSAANSAAILQADDHSFDLVRPGIAIYGGEALNDVPNPMKPVVTLEGRIIQIRSVKAGETVGYGSAETIKKDSRVAYVSVGYADGYHRGSSNMGTAMRLIAPATKAAFGGTIINGVGRISMDISAFDVSGIDENEITAGDWIELFGPTIPVDDVARAAGTIGYELLTGLGSRYSRTYLK
ncbi:MAG: alanine racemase [Rhizobiaceae bacterium]